MSFRKIERKSCAVSTCFGRRVRWGLAAGLAWAALLGAVAARATEDADRPRPVVTWDADGIVPGSPVVIEARLPSDVEVAEAVAGSERFAMAKTGEGVYRALVGIDLAFKGGTFPVDMELTPRRGEEPLRIRADLVVKGKVFGKQALSLPSDMVDLSESDSARAAKDSDLLRETLARRSPNLFWSGGFEEPLAGRTSTPYGSVRTMNGQARAPHGGVDIAAAAGLPVRAAADGVVALTAQMFFSGRTVVIDHGSGVMTLYAHMERVDVEAGQIVCRGDVLGAVGSTGRATGPHLHFAAFIRGARVDPLALVRAVRPAQAPVPPAPVAPSAAPAASVSPHP